MKMATMILGFEKTAHFLKRQKERNVDDREVHMLIQKGRARDGEGGTTIYSLGEGYVVVNEHQRILITVFPMAKTRTVKLGDLFRKAA